MCTTLVGACSVLPEYYDFQSFAIFRELDTLQERSMIVALINDHIPRHFVYNDVIQKQWILFGELRSTAS